MSFALDDGALRKIPDEPDEKKGKIWKLFQNLGLFAAKLAAYGILCLQTLASAATEVLLKLKHWEV